MFEQGAPHRVDAVLSEAQQAFQCQGALWKWSAATRPFEDPALRSYAFELLLGFAAPMLQLVGAPCVVAFARQRTAPWHSLVGEWMLSIWGDPRGLIMTNDEGATTAQERYNAHGSLPIFMPNANVLGTSARFNQFVLEYCGGKAPATRRTESTRAGPKRWCSLMLIHGAEPPTSNTQIQCPPLMLLPPEDLNEAAIIFQELTPVIRANYGIAGKAFAAWLTRNAEEIPAWVISVAKKVARYGRRRAYGHHIALAYGAAAVAAGAAHKLGLIAFNPIPALQYGLDAAEFSVYAASSEASAATSSASDALAMSGFAAKRAKWRASALRAKS